MTEKENEQFWNSSIDEIKKGYIEDDIQIKCLICGESFIKGKIYPINNEFYDAKKTAEIHIETSHNSMLDYLLNMNSGFSGVSEVQKELITMFSNKISDKEISVKLGIATSTIRNHRYKLREKEKQARVFLAIMELLTENTQKKINMLDKEVICDPHKGATTLDERFNTTDKEKKKVLESYFNEDGSLKNYPSKEKKKIIILEEIMKNFNRGKKYSEKEVNRILERIHEDYVTIRRALVEYGFIDRSINCSEYWIKE